MREKYGLGYLIAIILPEDVGVHKIIGDGIVQRRPFDCLVLDNTQVAVTGSKHQCIVSFGGLCLHNRYTFACQVFASVL